MKFASIFTDNMVIQAGRPFKIFGEGKGEVEITFLGEKYNLNSNEDEWCLTLPSYEYGGPYEMQINLNGEITVLKDIYVGEVWLACGQSNMEMPLFRTDYGFEEAKYSYNDKIRFFTVPRRYERNTDGYSWHFEVTDAKDTPWQICDEESALHFSAIGYYVAKELQEKLGIAIGVISCNWGGRPIEAFMNIEEMRKHDCFKDACELYDEMTKDLDMDSYMTEFKEYLNKWETFGKTVGNVIEEVSEKGIRATLDNIGYSNIPMPKGPYNFFTPGFSYESMFKRIIPYSVKGVLWYQGEGNNEKNYAKKYGIFMENMRRDFQNEDMPFYAVELAGFHNMQPLQDDRFVTENSWAFNREEQQKATKEYKNNYLVTSMELEAVYDWHPMQKKQLAHRMLLKILKHTYGFNIMADNPIYKSAKFENGKVYITLENAEGLYMHAPNLVKIYLADESKVLKRADIEIKNNMLILSSEDVKMPILARYGFNNCYLGGHIYNRAGLPLSPFRTDE